MNRCQPQPIESSSLAPTNKSDNSFSFVWRCRSPLLSFKRWGFRQKEKDKHWFQHSRKRIIYWNSSRAHSVQPADVNCQRVVFFCALRRSLVWRHKARRLFFSAGLLARQINTQLAHPRRLQTAAVTSLPSSRTAHTDNTCENILWIRFCEFYWNNPLFTFPTRMD